MPSYVIEVRRHEGDGEPDFIARQDRWTVLGDLNEALRYPTQKEAEAMAVLFRNSWFGLDHYLRVVPDPLAGRKAPAQGPLPPQPRAGWVRRVLERLWL